MALTAAGLVPGLASAERVPSFDDVLASKDVQALTDWARRYEHGVGVEQHTGRAVRLYCKAAERGDGAAKFQLGQIYAFGRGIERDQDLAVAWFHEAARAKDAKALGDAQAAQGGGQAQTRRRLPPRGPAVPGSPGAPTRPVAPLPSW